jgi:prepilin-type N-terminal cleavage/methylation domain-containing protein
MFRQEHHKRWRDEDGFTLQELLVAMLIIALLAAVAVPVFLHQRRKGWSAQALASIKHLASAQETWINAPWQYQYASTVVPDLTDVGFNFSDDTVLPTIKGATTTGYCLEVVSAHDDSIVWHLDSDVGRPEQGPAPDTCHGAGGGTVFAGGTGGADDGGDSGDTGGGFSGGTGGGDDGASGGSDGGDGGSGDGGSGDGGSGDGGSGGGGDDETPEYFGGNPRCDDLNSQWDEVLKIDPVTGPGTFTQGGATITIFNTVENEDGEVVSFDWTSDADITGVFVKGGPGGNLYHYDATGISAPQNKGISHISFCVEA